MALPVKVKEEVKTWVYFAALNVSYDCRQPVTFEDINSVLIDILHENSQHDPKELFKKQ